VSENTKFCFCITRESENIHIIISIRSLLRCTKDAFAAGALVSLVVHNYDRDQAQKVTSSSMSRHLSTRKLSSKSMHSFLINLANRQTDKHRGQSHLPPPLSEVMKQEHSCRERKLHQGRCIVALW